MRRALCLVLALGLAACTHAAKAPDQPSPVSADAGAIEVTPLAPPGVGGADAGKTGAATTGAATTGAATTGAATTGAAQTGAAAAGAVPVTLATASTPHPRPRPAGLGQGKDQGAAAAPAAAETAPPPKSQPQLQCEAAAGFWGQVGKTGAYLCQKMTKDGGKSCHKKGDCSGECLAPSQTCSPVAPLTGCNDVLDAEGRQVTLCID